jgi:hypothetical protein
VLRFFIARCFDIIADAALRVSENASDAGDYFATGENWKSIRHRRRVLRRRVISF